MINSEFKLNNGLTIPSLGLGTWKSEPAKAGEAVDYALNECGYKHIDCASIYGNEKEIGGVFKKYFESNKREEVFVTSKLWNNKHNPEDVEKACRETLEDLKLDYLDLYLMHWGIAFVDDGRKEPLDENNVVLTQKVSIRDTWETMENLIEKGLVKSIGVANFTTMMLFDLLTYAKIKPVMNQVELHPYLPQNELLKFCKYRDVQMTAYSPLGNPGIEKDKEYNLIEDETVVDLSRKYEKSPSQILINWAISRGTVVIPKSVTPARIKENFESSNFELSEEDVTRLSNLKKKYRIVDPFQWWGVPYFN